MYIAGRKRTASSPPRTLIDFASYLWPPCGVLLTFSLSPMSSPGVAIADVDLRRRTDPSHSEQASALKTRFLRSKQGVFAEFSVRRLTLRVPGSPRDTGITGEGDARS